MTENAHDDSLDIEWVILIKQALEAGIDKEEIRKFLKEMENSPVVEG